MSETRWRLTPLDDSGLVYFGMDVTNGNQAALVVRYDLPGFVKPEDRAFMEAILHLIDLDHTSGKDTEIENVPYRLFPWSREFDRGLATLIDRLVHMRMTNAQSVSLRLQLEMPI
jgi:hypothetical protein